MPSLCLVQFKYADRRLASTSPAQGRRPRKGKLARALEYARPRSRARRSEDGRADPGALTLPQVMDNGHLSAVKLIIIGATAAADMLVWSAVDAAAARVRFGPAAHDVRRRAPVRQWPWELLGRLPAAWRSVPRRDEARGLLGRVGMPHAAAPLFGVTCGAGEHTVRRAVRGRQKFMNSAFAEFSFFSWKVKRPTPSRLAAFGQASERYNRVHLP